MTPSWRLAKPARITGLKMIASALVAVAVGGCYQGWKRAPGPGNSAGGLGTGSGPGAKVIGVAIVDVISMSKDVMKSAKCSSVPGSLVEMRMAEAATRLGALQESLKDVAEVVKTVDTAITVDDCLEFRAVETRAKAVSAAHLSSIPAHLRLKPVLHIRFVYWSGSDGHHYPSPDVYANEWEDLRALQKQGFERRLSVNHFVLLGSTNNYPRYWERFAPAEATYKAEVIESPSATEEGLSEVNAAISRSTLGFSEWVGSKVRSL